MPIESTQGTLYSTTDIADFLCVKRRRVEFIIATRNITSCGQFGNARCFDDDALQAIGDAIGKQEEIRELRAIRNKEAVSQ